MTGRSVCLLFLFVYALCISAQTVDTIEVFSPKMDRNIKNVVILPADYNRSGTIKYPVLYLLHGTQANYRTWLKVIKPTLPQEATRLGMIIVCPDGENSWYLDSPVNNTSQFETYIAKELVEYIDSNYNTISSSKGRAITGFSMGGYGALRLTILHPGIFGACGSMSGAVDFRPFPKIYKLRTHIGEFQANKERWSNFVIINILDSIGNASFPIIIDCGKEDEFVKVNEELHNEMVARGIKHGYIVNSGKHNRSYWNKAIDYQLDFFSGFFNQK